MNILKTTTASAKWARTARFLVVYLAGAAALGISAFSLKLAAENATDLKQFAGTWECKYKGRAFFTLQMAVKDGAFGGTAVHSARVAWVDGELIPGTDETAQGRIFDTHASGQELLLKIADGPNVADPISLSFKLTGKDEAEVMPLVDQQGDVPPRKSRGIFNESATQNDMAGALAPRLSFAPNPARYILTGTLGLGSRNPPTGLAA